MKFQVREGFVVKLSTKVDNGNGGYDMQENTIFSGQVVDLTADQADLHAQKLEPKDKQATDYLAAKVAPQPDGAALGLTPEALALVQSLATQIATQVIAAAKAPAAATA